MAVLQDININVHGQPSEKRLQTFLRLSQNENGRMINFRVLGPPLPSNCTATFSGTKPDGNVYSKAGTVTGNFVIIEEDIQMTAVAGVWDAKLDIINGTHNIMTALIRVVVDADVVDPDAIASDSQLQGLVAEAKYYAEHARTDAYGSPLTAPTKAQMTDHTRVYVYTGSEPNMVAGNWYHWNGTAWISGGVYNAVAVQTDTTLSISGKAADAKKTGDEISSLKEDLNQLIGEYLNLPTPTNGYYRGIVGETITYTEQATSTAYQIDCSQYAGYSIVVNFETTATGSTRETCLCDANDKITARGMEKDITESGFKFDITSNNYKLYVSFSDLASNLSIKVMNGSVAILETDVDYLKTKVNACYVNNSTGNDSNDGTVLYPLKTIGKAINKGYKNIFVKPDTYSERVNLYDLDNVTISPYGVPEYAEGTYESKIILDGISTRSFGVYCTNCNNITLEGIEAINFATSGFRLIGCSNVKFIDCVAHDDAGTYQYANGFELINTNAEFINCIAHDVALDGFNMHGYGSTSFVNCVAYDCGDDGLSHHNACIGVVDGGEFYGNGKGGISSPTYGSYVNIYNAYCHNNLYGIYTVISSGQRTSKAVISNCLVKNNTNKDLYLRGVNAVGYNNIYDTKTVGEDATFTEY